MKMIKDYIKERESEFEKKFCAGGVLKTSILVHEDGLETVNDFQRQSIVGLVEKIRAEVEMLDKPNVGYGQGKLWLNGKEREVITHNYPSYEYRVDEVQQKIKEKILSLLSLEDLQDNGK